MFNLTGSEIVIILLLALIVLGPDKLPDAMRRAGRTWAEIKKISSGFQDEVRKGFEEPAAEVKKTASAVKQAASFANAPLKGAQKAAKGAAKSLLDPPKTPVVDTTATEAADESDAPDGAPDNEAPEDGIDEADETADVADAAAADVCGEDDATQPSEDDATP